MRKNTIFNSEQGSWPMKNSMKSKIFGDGFISQVEENREWKSRKPFGSWSKQMR
jgi:hypothetical protein